jgi:hypothetical protein
MAMVLREWRGVILDQFAQNLVTAAAAALVSTCAQPRVHQFTGTPPHARRLAEPTPIEASRRGNI